MNPLLFPPTIIKRAIDDLGAVADAARRLPMLEQQVVERIDRISAEGFARVDALAGELGAVRRAVEPLDERLVTVQEQLDDLREEMRPIQDMRAVREAVEPLDGRLGTMQAQLEALRRTAEPIEQITKVREGIESLDEDMRGLRDSVSDLEPLLREVNARLGTLDERIEMMRADLAPLGDLADKIPGVG